MSDQVLDALSEILASDQLITGDGLKERYSHIWKMNEGLEALAVAIPSTTNELSRILKKCNEYKQAVVVHGGLTNLVGGTETTSADLVISMERFDKIEETDTAGRTMTVQSGVVLQRVQEEADKHDLLFPLNFGAKGSAQMGGVISSNAGGLRVFRFGMTRQLILGLEAVLADGTIISSMKKIIKDNSGYDLKHLFIGSEGTLGVVTRAVVKLIEKPQSRCSAFVALDDYDKVLTLLKYCDRTSAGKLSGFELIWGETYKVMTSEPAKARPPLPQTYKYYVLIELMGGNQEQDQLLLQEILEHCFSNDMIKDAALAHSESDLNWFWGIREDVHAFVSLCQYDQHFDISMPLKYIGNYVDEASKKLNLLDDVEWVFPFGHVADGNVHFVIGKLNDSQELTDKVNEIIYQPLKDIGGSVSAEHGIGNHKKRYLYISRDENERALMQSLKKSMDPNNILNRGKVLDS